MGNTNDDKGGASPGNKPDKPDNTGGTPDKGDNSDWGLDEGVDCPDEFPFLTTTGTSYWAGKICWKTAKACGGDCSCGGWCLHPKFKDEDPDGVDFEPCGKNLCKL